MVVAYPFVSNCMYAVTDMNQDEYMQRSTPITTHELTELTLFQGESPEALEWMMDSCTFNHVGAGEILLQPGQDNSALFLILEGRVRIQLDRDDHQVLTYLEAGQSIGEMSVIEHAKASAYAIADTDCRLLRIEDETLWSLIGRSHTVACNLLFILSNRVRKNNRVVIESLKQQRFYEHVSKIDVLTGLYNRRWLDETLVNLIERCRHSGNPLSLILLDIDHFKAYNDNHGHLAGDRALKAVAKAIPQCMRPNDTAARFGGEEFTIVLPDTGRATAQIIAERICTGIRSEEIEHLNGQVLPRVTASAGVAQLEKGQSAEELLAHADEALYRAKDLGRDRVAC